MKPFNRIGRRARIRDRRRAIELGLERCEERVLLTVYTVDSLGTSGAGTLFDAITQANQNPDSTINFSVTGVIQLKQHSDLLPAVAVPTTILGTSAPGAPVVQIDGGGLTGDGLDLNTGGITIEGLSIVNFAGTGINVTGNADFVEGNYVGVDLSGASAPNTTGIVVASNGNTIGGTAAGAGNTIAFNTQDGVDVNSGLSNSVQGNLIYNNQGKDLNVANTITDAANAPTGLVYTSVANLTTIDYTITGTANQTYTLDFFATSGSGSSAKRPAAVYLGSSGPIQIPTATFSGSMSFPTQVPSGQLVTATLTQLLSTPLTGTTSNFATSVSIAAPFTVSTGSDNVIGSLRQAILDVNAAGGIDPTVNFTLPTPFTITPTSPLPALTQQATIDGTSLSGFTFGSKMVEVNGSTNSIAGDGLTLSGNSGGSIIKGLDIVGFTTGAGIHVESAGDQMIENYLGLTTGGTTGANQVGVLVDQVGGASIGGSVAGTANAIGFNSIAGIQIVGSVASGPTDALVQGNLIGTNAAGTAHWGNATGVQVFNASGNTIGGTTAGSSTPAANVIGNTTSASAVAGIAVLSGTGNAINANSYFGSNGTLTTPSVAANDIGVSVGANGNVQPPSLLSASLSANNATLSLALTGNVAVATTLDVYLFSAGERKFLGEMTINSGSFSGSLPVSGLTAGTSQIVATQSNSTDGTSAFSAPLLVQPASVVTNANASGPGSLDAAIVSAEGPGGQKTITFQIPGTGPFTIPVSSPGLSVTVGGVTINGTSEPGYAGTPLIVLSGGGSAANGLDLTANGDTIEGLKFTGFTGSDILVGSQSNTIGGTTAGQGNVFSTATSVGVSITGASNVLEGNFIGTDAAGDNLGGTGSQPGSNSAVIIDNIGSNMIGGTTAGSPNVIAFSSVGVSITGSSASANVLQGNFIGTNAGGVAQMGNTLGVVINGAGNNTVGGTAANAGNTFAFNAFDATHGVLTVNAGTGNEILTNLFYSNTGTTPAASGIDLTNLGNNGLAAPVITSVTASGSGSTNLTLDVSKMTAGTYQLDVFASAPGDNPPAGQVDARVPLGTVSVTIKSGDTTETVTLTKALSGGQQVTATWTVVAPAPSGLTAGDTSEFSATAAVPQPFVVTTTDGSVNTAGSLAFEIAAVNNDKSNNTDTIQFQLQPGQATGGIWMISPSAALTISHPVILDGTTQAGYAGAPVIEISGQGLSLAGGSNGSTIRGLDIVNVAGAGITVASNSDTVQGNYVGILPDGQTAAGNGQGIVVSGTGNTIGGPASGAGNLVADNNGAGISVTAPNTSANAVRGNLIYGNTGAAFSTNSSVGVPVLNSVTSNGGTTTIHGSFAVAPTVGTIIDLYASNGTLVPAAIYLGSTALTAGSINGLNFTASVTGASVPTGASVVATATSPAPGSDTSGLSNSKQAANPFAVTTAADNGNNANPTPGSLRAAINNVIADTGNPNADTITFAIVSGPVTITLTSAELNALNHPVVLDATTQPGYTGTPLVTIDASGLSGPVLTLASGSNGSTIRGLVITDFTGTAIEVDSNSDLVQSNTITVATSGATGVAIKGTNDTVGGGSANTGNTITYANGTTAVDASAAGVSGAAIRANVLTTGGTTGTAIKPDSAAPGAPTISSATSNGGTTTIHGSFAVAPAVGTILDLYASNGSQVPAAIYLGSTTLTANSISGTSFTASVTGASVPTGASVVATATSPAPGGDTSGLSNSKQATNPFAVITAADNGDNANPTPGSLRAAINNVIADTGNPNADTITFAIGTGPVTITLTSAELNALNHPVILDATTQPGYTGTPLVTIDASGLSGPVLTLASGSNGSTIRGLVITDFTGTAIEVDSNSDLVQSNTIAVATSGATGVVIKGTNDTVGGASANTGNTITYVNGTTAVDASAGTQAAIRANLLTTGGTSGTAIAPDAAAPAAPSLGAFSGVGTTTIQVTTSGYTANATYTLDFFASSAASGSPAAVFLGSKTITPNTSGLFTQSFVLDISVPFKQTVTATATSPGNDTSALATSVTVANPFVVTTTADDAVNPIVGSLRQVINSINAAAAGSTDTITFDIQTSDPNYDSATGTFLIKLSGGTLLPAINPKQSAPVTVNGTSQPGYAGTPLIDIDANGASAGLTLGANSTGSTIQGLSIVDIAGPAILVQSPNDLIINDYLGVPTTSKVVGSQTAQVGVEIDNVGPTTIGGTAATGNLIGLNATGVSITGASGANNLVAANFIGTDPAGDNLGNGTGIAINNAGQTTIGGTAATANVIGFNVTGIAITGVSGTKNVVAANFIGTNAAGTAHWGNTTGIVIDGNASNNSIGASVSGAGSTLPTNPAANTIAFNSNGGVDINSGSGNTVEGNLIHDNGNPLLSNQDLNVASTANAGIAAPTGLAYTSVATLTTINYTITGATGTYTLDFYASNGTVGSTNLTAPVVYLGSSGPVLVTSGQTTTQTFTFTAPLKLGQVVTATVTDPNGNTSNFAANAMFSDAYAVSKGTDNATNPIVGSLRQAILDVNADPTDAKPITFASVSLKITPTSPLPAITQPIVINGTTVTNYAFGSAMVQLNGSLAGGGDGLTLSTGSNGSTIEGLNIVGFSSAAGIRVGSDNNQIFNDYVGALPNANPVPAPNAQGIFVSGSNNTIGGTAAGQPNTIAGNNGPAVTVNAGTGDLISGDAIFNNLQGIVLQNNGNKMLSSSGTSSPPPPTLISASVTGSQISISGTLTGLAPSTLVFVEFFASDATDNALYPDQANYYLGNSSTPPNMPVTTKADGTYAFSVTLTIPAGVTIDTNPSNPTLISATVSATGLGTSQLASSISASTPFAVTTTADNGDNTNPVVGSLRAAIIAANNSHHAQTIDFDLPTTGPGAAGYDKNTGTWTITLDPTPLPPITVPMVIDGTTQPGYFGQAAINPTAPPPVVLIDGAGAIGDGLELAPGSGGSTVKGLGIFGFVSGGSDPITQMPFAGAGIEIQSDGNTIAADWLGEYTGGGSPNAVGLEIDGGSNNTVGLGAVLTINQPPGSTLSGTLTGVSGLNLISGNSGDGIFISSVSGGEVAQGNLIQDTFIGTDITGTNPLGNHGYGIEIDNSMNNTVGGSISGTLVLVSGNSKGGILIQGDPFVVPQQTPLNSDNLVQNTYIGTNYAGTAALPNGSTSPRNSVKGDGIDIVGSTGNIIGGTLTLTNTDTGVTVPVVDLISGNTGAGVSISGGAGSNIVENSYIGSDILGQHSVANSVGGVVIDGSSNNTVGSTTTGFTTLISGNTGTGVLISGSTSQGNAIINSLIGPDLTGSNTKFVLHNSQDGIDIVDATGTTVGFTTTTQGATVSGGNVISGNLGTGVSISGAASGTKLLYNKIGTDSTGTFSNVGLASQNYGVVVGGSSSKTTIGGTVSSVSGYALQVVSWGGGAGVPTSGDQLVVTGIDSAGLLHIRTFDAAGVLTDTYETQDPNGALHLVTADAAGTVLSNVLESSLSRAELNAIATLKQQLPALVPPHMLTGAETATVLQQVTSIVGSTVGSFNIISGNKKGGIEVDGDAGSDLIQGNIIGTNITGAGALGNSGDGIDVIGSVSDTIGGSVAGTGNLISSNQGAGISITGTAAPGGDVFGNVIGTDILRSLALGNTGSGIVIAGSSDITIGSAGSGGNWIAGNLGYGLDIEPGSSNNTVVSNSIGGTIGGSVSALIGNDLSGIFINNSSGNTIGAQPTALTSVGTPVSLIGGANQILGNGGDGILEGISGTTSAANTITGNLVSRNSGNGIHLYGDLSGDQVLPTITGNFIGTLLSGASTYDSTANNQPQGNGHSGILLESTFTASATGGNAAMISGNVISNNGLSGVTVQNPNGTVTPADVLIQKNAIGTDNQGQNVTPQGPNSASLLFGNVLDGIRLVDVTGVTIGATTASAAGGAVSVALATSGGNLIAGNVGRGIELDNAGANAINDNLIGVVLAAGGQSIAAFDAQNNNAGNLSDGIFVLNSSGDTIAGNLVSNNRGYGIHAEGGGTILPILSMSITSNFIGTNNDGTSAVNLGNGADGVFLDTVSGVTVGGTASGAGNVISGNHANGVDLLNSSLILIVGNDIGTNATGFSKPGDATLDMGNASNGVFINQSIKVTVGGSGAGAGNIISGNHASGVFISGVVVSTDFDQNRNLLPGHMGTNAYQNVVQGNQIGVGTGGAVPNAVAGVILSNADYNTIGGGGTAANVISGNSLDGILLVNTALNDTIQGNDIGTDSKGSRQIGNSADGIFLLGSTAITVGGGVANTGGTISGNAIAGNVIAGNNQDGIQVFGTGAINNTFTDNTIGLSGVNGTALGNGGDGILLNNAGTGNIVGGTSAADQNVISGNNQAGVEITNTTTGTVVEGNDIGTSTDGTRAIGNGGPGVQIYASSGNIIGGATTAPGTGAGNVVSGNAQAGVQIFNPGGFNIAADSNQILGNLIGTNAAGTAALSNGSDGVQIQNGSNNVVGGSSSVDRNIISGNAGNGVSIVQFPNLGASNNQVLGNYIGTNIKGDAALGLGNASSGVELIDGSGNVIGGSGGNSLPNTEVPASDWTGNTPGNVISGNNGWGILIQLTGTSTGPLKQSSVQGNDIGMNASGTLPDGNAQGGVFVNNITNTTLGQMIGGTASGAGNLISGNANVGIELAGQSATGNVIAGNLIGLDVHGNVVGTGNVTGIYVQSSSNNSIGGVGDSARNVISGNSSSGVSIAGTASSGNLILSNFIGTDLTGYHFPNGSSEGSPAQAVGVEINGASGNTVGGSALSNVISGNGVGVEIAGVRQSGGFAGGGNVVTGNMIGTDPTGKTAVSNLDLGVFVNNSASNIIGPGNVISANGIAGVELVSDGSSRNVVTGNIIGLSIELFAFPSRGQTQLSSNGPEPGIPVFTNSQNDGVVILGASNNTVGADSSVNGSAGNIISGNLQVGVYITSRDFNNVHFSVPTGNTVSGNVIQTNHLYGILLYDAPNNAVRPFTSPSKNLSKNTFGGESTAFRNFQAAFDAGALLPLFGRKGRHHAKTTHAVHRPKAHHQPASSKKHVTVAHVEHPAAVQHGHVVHPAVVTTPALLRARPRVPALFEGIVEPPHKDKGHKA